METNSVIAIHTAYLNCAEAAAYLRYRNASGIRAAVRRGELAPDGAAHMERISS